jgi:IclR family mhp operon transcriptional activator
VARNDNLSSLKRGLTALALLNVRESLTASQLAAELGLARTTARRVLDTLVEEGYVEKLEDRVYRITPMVNLLSGGFSDESWMTRVAEPILMRKTLELGWPLALATPAGESMMCRVSTDRLTPLAVDHFSVGFKVPILHGTSGHVMLAYMAPRHRAELLRALQNSTDQRQALARDEARLRATLDQIRAQGYSNIVYREYPEASVGVPVFIEGKVHAVLLLTYAKTALRPAQIRTEYVPMLQALSREITTSVSASKRQRRAAESRRAPSALPSQAQAQAPTQAPAQAPG